jgi:hypothetical protein
MCTPYPPLFATPYPQVQARAQGLPPAKVIPDCMRMPYVSINQYKHHYNPYRIKPQGHRLKTSIHNIINFPSNTWRILNDGRRPLTISGLLQLADYAHSLLSEYQHIDLNQVLHLADYTTACIAEGLCDTLQHYKWHMEFMQKEW